MKAAKEVPYQTVENGEVKIEYKKAVLSLEVTPHVIGNNTLKLNINTKKDELDFANAVGGQPAINTKKATTNVLLFDGQTTVIGGLSKENCRKERVRCTMAQRYTDYRLSFQRQKKQRQLRRSADFHYTPYPGRAVW